MQDMFNGLFVPQTNEKDFENQIVGGRILVVSFIFFQFELTYDIFLVSAIDN